MFIKSTYNKYIQVCRQIYMNTGVGSFIVSVIFTNLLKMDQKRKETTADVRKIIINLRNEGNSLQNNANVILP